MSSLLDSNLPVTSNDFDESAYTTLSPMGPFIPLPIHSSALPSSPLSPSFTTTSSSIMSSAAASANTADNDGSKSSQSASAGLIVGIIFLIIVVIGLILFFVRRNFIRKRDQKTTATRVRLSRSVISGPTNFQHLGTGRVNVSGEGGAAQISGFTVSNPSTVNLHEEDTIWDPEEAQMDRVKGKYSYNFGALESGLSDHVETMRKNQQRPNRI